MLRLVRWIVILAAHAQDVREPSDAYVPRGWRGNPWGPAATHARAEGEIPPVVPTPGMKRLEDWGRSTLRDGDIAFRMGDTRILFGLFSFSRFLADATGSRFSHAGIVAIEDGSPFVYDCTKAGVRRMPFAVWMLDNHGPFGVKRLRPEWRGAIPGALAYCREVFARQVPFDYEFEPDDAALYCLEMTEKAFRSQGLPLSQPVRLGDMENALQFPIAIGLFLRLSPLVLRRPFDLDRPVYMPGNARHGIWGSACLEAVYPPAGAREVEPVPPSEEGFSVRGDLAILGRIALELRASARGLRAGRAVLRSAAGTDAVSSATAERREPRPPRP